MGLLAGSTVMLITVIWGSCVIVGKCDIRVSHRVAIDGQDTQGFNLLRSGVSTDKWTCYAARIMVASLLPYIVVQITQLLGSSSEKHLAVLIALIIALSGLATYCIYQAFQPWIQKRKLKYVQHRHVMSGVLRHLQQRALGRFLDDEGQLDTEIVKKLFDSIDENKDGFLSASEMKALIIGIRFSEIDFDMDDAVARIMRDFDKSQDDRIDITEFSLGIIKWLLEARRAGASFHEPQPETSKFLSVFHLQTTLEHALLAPGDQQGDEENRENASGEVDSSRWTTIQAVLLLLLGTIMAAVFADPLVDAVDYFSDATGIPTFFISFVVLPLVTNTSEAVSAVIFASRKRIKTASLTFSELYGAVTMNNLLCLSVFLALVYARELTWDFSSEILVILIVCIVMGGFASFRTTFPLWTLFLAYFLYPFALALVYVLDYVLGWS